MFIHILIYEHLLVNIVKIVNASNAGAIVHI